MIDLPATDVSCIYSLMKFTVALSERYGMFPVLTFDQPLYWKALNIQYQDESGAVAELTLMLGQFHSRMACLAAIGALMTNSGIEDVIKLVYADNSGNNKYLHHSLADTRYR